MNTENFIFEFDDFYSKEECEYLIKIFERYSELGLTATRAWDTVSNEIDDEQLFSADMIESLEFSISKVGWIKDFDQKFWEYAYPPYVAKFGTINQMDSHTLRYLKVQKTLPSQGFHLWHFENMQKPSSTRILTWILYLNDIEDGGETEWLYFSKRVSPKQGKLVLWPAGFTHTHRGNPPLKDVKYIFTGWVEFH